MKGATKLSFEGCSIHGLQAGELQKILRDTLSNGSVNIILVGGPSGTGKTHLVRSSFSNPEQKYFFASAKIDQRGDSSPFKVIRDIFSEVVRQINDLEPEEVKRCRKVLQEGFQSSQRCQEHLVNLIPSTSDLFEQSGSVKDSAPGETREVCYEVVQFSNDDLKSTRLAVRTFLRAVSTVLPVVLFLDDMMWSDEDSFETFHFLLSDNRLNNVLSCATYRDDETVEKLSFNKWKTNLEAEFDQSIHK